MRTHGGPSYMPLDSTTFRPADYNRTYYSKIMEDEAALVEWQAGHLDRRIRAHLDSIGRRTFDALREAGSGPSVHHLFALEKYVDTIHLSDFLAENLDEVRRWVRGDGSAHDWRPFVEAILLAEGEKSGPEEIAARERSVREKVSTFSRFDLKGGLGVGPDYAAALVSSFFVADSATGAKDVFRTMTSNAFSLVKPGGLFVAAYLGACAGYLVGDQWLVSADLSQEDIEEALVDCGAVDIDIARFDTPSMSNEGFDHIFAVVAGASSR